MKATEIIKIHKKLTEYTQIEDRIRQIRETTAEIKIDLYVGTYVLATLKNNPKIIDVFLEDLILQRSKLLHELEDMGITDIPDFEAKF